jgi:hypothetical protein
MASSLLPLTFGVARYAGYEKQTGSWVLAAIRGCRLPAGASKPLLERPLKPDAFRAFPLQLIAGWYGKRSIDWLRLGRGIPGSPGMGDSDFSGSTTLS